MQKYNASSFCNRSEIDKFDFATGGMDSFRRAVRDHPHLLLHLGAKDKLIRRMSLGHKELRALLCGPSNDKFADDPRVDDEGDLKCFGESDPAEPVSDEKDDEDEDEEDVEME
jgi:hypothetical protein